MKNSPVRSDTWQPSLGGMFAEAFKCLLLLAVMALASAACGADVTFFPVNADIYELRLSPKETRMFVRDSEEPSALVGEGGWMGELRDGNAALLLSEDQRNGFLFVNGLLRKRLIDGREQNVKPGKPSATGTAEVKKFWPPKETRLKAGTAPTDYWSDDSRLRLWFTNPNLAGGLLALGALAMLGLVFLRRLPWKIAGIVGAMTLLALLVKTESRASMLAFVFGCGLMALTRLRKLFSWKIWLPIAVCGALACGYVVLQKNSSRFTTNMFKEGDAKISRIPIWMEVPRMVADAPWGWGVGNSGKSYVRWYQKKNTCLLENLVSGHCTFLVEHGWPLRFLYLFAWGFALVASVRAALRGSTPAPLAVFGAFALLGMFHPVIYSWELWIVPVGVALLAARQKTFRDISRGSALIAGGCALLLCVAIFAFGAYGSGGKDRLPIAGKGDRVAINGSASGVWIVDDDYVLHGGYWWTAGKAMRDWCAAKPNERNLGYARSIDAVPPSCTRLVLVGEAGEPFCGAWSSFLDEHPNVKEIVFLSPSFSANDIPTALAGRCGVRVVQGSVAARVAGYAELPSGLAVVPGACLYIPDWLDRVADSPANRPAKTAP